MLSCYHPAVMFKKAFMLNNNSQETCIAQVELLWQQSRHSAMLACMVSTMACLLLWPYVEPLPLVIWGIFALILSMGRIALLNKWLQLHPIETQPERFLSLVSYTMLFPGFSWMLLTLLYVPMGDNHVFLIVSILIAGMIATSMPVLSSSVVAYISFIALPAIGIISMSWIYESVGIAIIFFMSGVVFIIAARKNNRFILRAITLDIDNKRLLSETIDAKKIIEKTSQSKSHFLAGISHDLRQPLQALSIFLDLLKPLQPNKKSEKLLGKAITAQNDLSETFTALLELSRFESGEFKIDIQVMDIKAISDNFSEPYRILASNKGLDFSIDMPSVNCLVDRFLLARICNNLLSNAIKFTERGRVQITGKVDNKKLVISVKDTGTGIDKEAQQSIFNAYYQVEKKQRQKGVGLGLNLAYEMCEKLGSHLYVISEKDKGSEFYFSLPLAEQQQDDKNNEQATILNGQVAPNKTSLEIEPGLLMLVEDNPEVSDAIKHLFTQWEWSVHSTDSFEKLSADNQKHLPDLVISDYDLNSQFTGIDTIKEIRQQWQQDVPAIILTGRSDAKSLAAIKKENIYPLVKPVKLPQLQTAMKYVMQSEQTTTS